MSRSITIGPQLPKNASPLSQSYGTDAKRPPAPYTPPHRDVTQVTGMARPSQSMASAEQALGRLLEMGLLESASRPLSPDGEALLGDTVTITVKLDGPTPDSEPEVTQPDQEPRSVEEWRPYQRPTPAQQALGFLQEDGQSITLTLFNALSGGEQTLNLGDVSILLNENGSLLAALLDGTYRAIVLNQDILDFLLNMGQVTVAENPAQTANQTDSAPENPDLENFAPADRAPDQPAQAAETVSDPARPGGEKPSAPATAQPLSEPDTVSITARTGVKLLVPPQEDKPGGAEEWDAMKSVEKSFREMTETWRQESFEPNHPDAQTRLNDLRQAWVTGLQREDPAAFRAWLEIHVKPEAQDGNLKDALVPKGFTQKDYNRWMEHDILSYPTKFGVETQNRWITELITRMLNAEKTPAVPEQKNPYETVEAAAQPQNTGDLVRRCAELIGHLFAGTYGGGAKEAAGSMDTQEPPERRKDELDEAWKRRQIAFEVDSAWTKNMKQWLSYVDGWHITRRQSYVNGKVNEWTTGLMQNHPAQFRHWLSSPLRHAAGAGWFNQATGSFPIHTLPEGFTDEDYRRWMRLDVLDYL